MQSWYVVCIKKYIRLFSRRLSFQTFCNRLLLCRVIWWNISGNSSPSNPGRNGKWQHPHNFQFPKFIKSLMMLENYWMKIMDRRVDGLIKELEWCVSALAKQRVWYSFLIILNHLYFVSLCIS